MSKNLVLLRDVINVYHPRFRNNKRNRAEAIKDPDIFNVERLYEESLSAVGPYNFINAAHKDFSDTSDAKTSTITLNPNQIGGNNHRGTVTGVSRITGGCKEGPLRVAIYDPHTDSLLFYFLPKPWWINNIIISRSTNAGRIEYYYHKPSRRIAKFQGFECASFEELALKVA